ncbi:hypothetical protein HG1285_18834 [Hydrogenivirga sp. 128-5-R1-1]|nr:hypothetical protein HG1285_18834 [Hydrogenivirga sp. 128-5-R1-1]
MAVLFSVNPAVEYGRAVVYVELQLNPLVMLAGAPVQISKLDSKERKVFTLNFDPTDFALYMHDPIVGNTWC